MKIPFATQMAICRRYMYVSADQIAKEFNVSRGAVYNALKRNADVVESLETFMGKQTAKNQVVSESDLQRITGDN